MTECEPDGPYVYQRGPAHQMQSRDGRIYAVGGVSMYTELYGLTKDEAEKICLALKELANA